MSGAGALRWPDLVGEAVRALFEHRLRTVLSILGITIGIAAVMAVSAISAGGNRLVFSELETFGLNSVWIYRDWDADALYETRRDGSGISAADLDAIERDRARLGLRRVTPVVTRDDSDWRIRHADTAAVGDPLGVGHEYHAIVNDVIAAGRGLMRVDVERGHAVVVLGPDVATRLFGRVEFAIGKTVRLRDRRLQVVGVLASKSRDFLASIGSEGGQNADDRIVLPYTVMERMIVASEIDFLQLEATSFDTAETSAAMLKALLTERHRGDYAYETETMATHAATAGRIVNGVTAIGIVAASISLIVGGMGIMNIMSTAVLERTREIGLRKAIGATEGDIRLQFLTEAALISLVGGVFGLAIGSLAAVGLGEITGIPIVPTPLAIGIALVVSVGVGLLSGLLPATRAARLPPVEALRTA